MNSFFEYVNGHYKKKDNSFGVKLSTVNVIILFIVGELP